MHHIMLLKGNRWRIRYLLWIILETLENQFHVNLPGQQNIKSVVPLALHPLGCISPPKKTHHCSFGIDENALLNSRAKVLVSVCSITHGRQRQSTPKHIHSLNLLHLKCAFPAQF